MSTKILKTLDELTEEGKYIASYGPSGGWCHGCAKCAGLGINAEMIPNFGNPIREKEMTEDEVCENDEFLYNEFYYCRKWIKKENEVNFEY